MPIADVTSNTIYYLRGSWITVIVYDFTKYFDGYNGMNQSLTSPA